MGELGRVRFTFIFLAVFLFLLLPACGGHKPPGTSTAPAKITLTPSTTASMQFGSLLNFTATALNDLNKAVSPTFTYASSNSSVVDISPTGIACAGTWNAPFYNVCTPGSGGTAEITASALGASSSPTLVFVHAPIDTIQISVVPPVNPPPPACPAQTALPIACDIPFKTNNCLNGVCSCISQNQVQTLQATAFSQGVDITPSVGPFTWNEPNATVVKVTPIVSGSSNYPTNQAQYVAGTPGATQVVASASGVSSQPYIAETCPVQCISLELGSNGAQNINDTTFIANKGVSETVTATAVDVQGCIVPSPPLTWTSTAPAALTAGSATAGCGAGSTCNITTTQPGAAAITASCTPPTCNIPAVPIIAGTPTNLYVPQPVYPVSAISGLVTGATNSASVFATSQDCYSNSQCTVALYDISTTTNLAASPFPLPAPPNSFLFDSAGDKAYVGSQYGSFFITTSNLGSSSTNPFTSLPAAQTLLGLVTGKVIGVSPNGSLAVFSDTISTPNQVYVVNTTSSATATALNINSATLAVFSPDNSKAFILGNGGNTLYVYSPLQSLQTLPALTAPANAIAFSSSGAFAFIAGGSSTASIPVLNTCNNAPASADAGGTFSITGLPATPLFLKMIPPGSAPTGNALIPNLYQTDFSNSAPNFAPNAVDVFIGVDNTGLDVFATSTITRSAPAPTTLCPLQTLTLATEAASPTTTFNPIHIPLNKPPFHPISFFLSPDSNQVYIVTTDQGVLVYNFSTGVTGTIQLTGNAAPIAADMTVDGTLIYVAGTDGTLHELNTLLNLDVMEIPFSQLANSSNNFCYSSYTCSLNIVAIKP